MQKGFKDCGCFAIAFCISLLYGNNTAAMVYDQRQMRMHIVNCSKNMQFTHFPGVKKGPKDWPSSLLAPIIIHIYTFISFKDFFMSTRGSKSRLSDYILGRFSGT